MQYLNPSQWQLDILLSTLHSKGSACPFLSLPFKGYFVQSYKIRILDVLEFVFLLFFLKKEYFVSGPSDCILVQQIAGTRAWCFCQGSFLSLSIPQMPFGWTGRKDEMQMSPDREEGMQKTVKCFLPG